MKNRPPLAVIAFFLLAGVSFSTAAAPPDSRASFPDEPPAVITQQYIESHFYNRPAEIAFDAAEYGLNGKKTYVSALTGNDAWPGTEKQPLRTIQKAVNGAAPGDTIHVMEGTYWNTREDNIASFYDKHGTPDHWIMLRNFPGHHPLLRFSGWDAVSLQGSSYIIVSGLVIRGEADKVSYQYAFDHRQDKNNPTTMGNGIAVVLAWDNHAKRSHHVIAANNIVYNCPGQGLYAIWADYFQFLNNIVCYNCRWSPNSNSGISMYQNQPVDRQTGVKVVVAGNVSYANENRIPFGQAGVICDGNGIIVDDTRNTQTWFLKPVDGPYPAHILLENNVCFHNGGHGIHVYSSQSVIVRQNTCFQNGFTPDFTAAGVSVVESTEVTVSGNISVAPETGGDRAVNVENAARVFLSYNLFQGAAIPPTGGDNAIIDRDPQFVHPTVEPVPADFALRRKSPAVDCSPDGPAKDIVGEIRPKGPTFDLGAYEY